MDKFVVDTGPFIHLDQINQITLLRKLSFLFTPASVVLEIKKGNLTKGLKTIKNWANMKIISPHRKSITSPIDNIIKKSNLEAGETDCIYLAIENHPCIFLTDDLTARVTAQKLCIEVHGSVGIIAYAVKQKWLSIEKAIESLNQLYYHSNLFITYAIIENAVQSLKDFAGKSQ